MLGHAAGVVLTPRCKNSWEWEGVAGAGANCKGDAHALCKTPGTGRLCPCCGTAGVLMISLENSGEWEVRQGRREGVGMGLKPSVNLCWRWCGPRVQPGFGLVSEVRMTNIRSAGAPRGGITAR